MYGVSHQTVKLGKGKHSSPEQGACVMELASMLAGEPFSDHPRSVCRVIGAFLRSYNDMVDDERRQDLYAYAAKVVGTAGPHELETLRAERLLEWTDEIWDARRWAVLTRARRRFGRRRRTSEPQACARDAVGAIGKPSDTSHAAVLDLIDELVALGPSAVAREMPLASAARGAPETVETR